MTRTYHPNPQFQLRLVVEKDVVMGPGKADLLEAIARTGSISSASREMGLSYKKAWQLIITMNERFPGPVVTTESGGSQRGGAALTPLGESILSHYRKMQSLIDPEHSPEAKALMELLTTGSGES